MASLIKEAAAFLALRDESSEATDQKPSSSSSSSRLSGVRGAGTGEASSSTREVKTGAVGVRGCSKESAEAARKLAISAEEARNIVVLRLVMEWAASSSQQLAHAASKGGGRGGTSGAEHDYKANAANDSRSVATQLLLSREEWWGMVRQSICSCARVDPKWKLPQSAGLGLLQNILRAASFAADGNANAKANSVIGTTTSPLEAVVAAGEALCSEPSPLHTTMDAFGNALDLTLDPTSLSHSFLPARLQASLLKKLYLLQQRSTNQRRVFADCCGRLSILANLIQSGAAEVADAARDVLKCALFHKDHLEGYQSAFAELATQTSKSCGDVEVEESNDPNPPKRRKRQLAPGSRTCYQSQLMDSLRQMESEGGSLGPLYVILPELLEEFINATNEECEIQRGGGVSEKGGSNSKKLGASLSARQLASLHSRQLGFWSWLVEIVESGISEPNQSKGSLCAALSMLALLSTHNIYIPSEEKGGKHLLILRRHALRILAALESSASTSCHKTRELAVSCMALLSKLNHLILHEQLPRVLRVVFQDQNGRKIHAGPVELMVHLLKTYSRLRQMQYLVKATMDAADEIAREGTATNLRDFEDCIISSAFYARWQEALRSAPQGQFGKIWEQLVDLTRDNLGIKQPTGGRGGEKDAALGGTTLSVKLLTVYASSVLVTTHSADVIEPFVGKFLRDELEPFLTTLLDDSQNQREDESTEGKRHEGAHKKASNRKRKKSPSVAIPAELARVLPLYAALLDLQSRCNLWGISSSRGAGERKGATGLSLWLPSLKRRVQNLSNMSFALQGLALWRIQEVEICLVEARISEAKSGDVVAKLEAEARDIANFASSLCHEAGWWGIVPHLSTWATYCTDVDASHFTSWLARECATELGSRAQSWGQELSPVAENRSALALISDALLFEIPSVSKLVFSAFLQLVEEGLTDLESAATSSNSDLEGTSDSLLGVCCSLQLLSQLPSECVRLAGVSSVVIGLHHLLESDMRLFPKLFSLCISRGDKDQLLWLVHHAAFCLRTSCVSISASLPPLEHWQLDLECPFLTQISESGLGSPAIPVESESLYEVTASLARTLSIQGLLGGRALFDDVKLLIQALNGDSIGGCIVLRGLLAGLLDLLEAGTIEVDLPLALVAKVAQKTSSSWMMPSGAHDELLASARADLCGLIIRVGAVSNSVSCLAWWPKHAVHTILECGNQLREMSVTAQGSLPDTALCRSLLNLLCDACASINSLPQECFESLASYFEESDLLGNADQHYYPMLAAALALLTINSSRDNIVGLLDRFMKALERPNQGRGSSVRALGVIITAGRGAGFESGIESETQALALGLVQAATKAAVGRSEAGTAVTRVALRALDRLLSRRSYPNMTARSISFLLGALGPVVGYVEDPSECTAYVASIARSLVRFYPRRVFGSLPTLVSLCGSLLRSCMLHGARANKEGVVGADAVSRLLGALRPHRSIIGRYVPAILAVWLSCRTKGDRPSKPVLDAAYTLIDLCSARELAQVPRLVPAEGSELFRALHADYLKLHKFSGQV